MFDPLSDLSDPRRAVSRSVSAENPTGGKSAGALAVPTDPGAHPASARLGKGWKVRPCLRDLAPGTTTVLADISGPGAVRHVWCTVAVASLPGLRLRVFYDGLPVPAIDAPLGDLFANGLDGRGIVNSLPVTVNPCAGMNWYWPMPFRSAIRLELVNTGTSSVSEFFYQVDYTLEEVPVDTAYLHAHYARTITTQESPEHTLLDVRGRGRYVGTYLTWEQRSAGWWGEGEVKFFIDGDPPEAPTICGTGTEDYVGGAYCFAMEIEKHQIPTTYSAPFAGYPQWLPAPVGAGWLARHGMYRWHIPDPIFFERDLRITVQALGWWPDGTYQPLCDVVGSVAWWYGSYE